MNAIILILLLWYSPYWGETFLTQIIKFQLHCWRQFLAFSLLRGKGQRLIFSWVKLVDILSWNQLITLSVRLLLCTVKPRYSMRQFDSLTVKYKAALIRQCSFKKLVEISSDRAYFLFMSQIGSKATTFDILWLS